ncbi:MAG: hypothetical protein QM661_08815 [Solimonas sp.]
MKLLLTQYEDAAGIPPAPAVPTLEPALLYAATASTAGGHAWLQRVPDDWRFADAPAIRRDDGARVSQHLCETFADEGPVRVPGEILMLVAFEVPAPRRREVDDWYLQEHVPLLLKADGWYRARPCHAHGAAGSTEQWSHIAFHDMRDERVLDSRERAAARSTAWRARLADEAWFAAAGRWVYRRVTPIERAA